MRLRGEVRRSALRADAALVAGQVVAALVARETVNTFRLPHEATPFIYPFGCGYAALRNLRIIFRVTSTAHQIRN